MLDEREEAIGAVKGVEIMDFPQFEERDLVPEHWQHPAWPPLPPRGLLQRLQTELRAREHAAPAQAPVAAPA